MLDFYGPLALETMEFVSLLCNNVFSVIRVAFFSLFFFIFTPVKKSFLYEADSVMDGDGFRDDCGRLCTRHGSGEGNKDIGRLFLCYGNYGEGGETDCIAYGRRIV